MTLRVIGSFREIRTPAAGHPGYWVTVRPAAIPVLNIGVPFSYTEIHLQDQTE